MPTYPGDLDAADDLRLDELLADVCDLVGIDHGYIDALRDAVDNAVAMAEGD